jgi:acid phosphatase family membrane protein YuiD
VQVFLVAMSISVLVQLFKFFSHWAITGHPHLARLFQTGGMPSSHSAAVCALSTHLLVTEGADSLLFGVALFFSLIVMYDAAGLRRAAGMQAVILNQLLEEHQDRRLRERRLLELLGHTPFEVLVGAALGIAFALAWNAI